MDRDSLQLVADDQSKKKDVSKCIICQLEKPGVKLSNTLNGIQNVINASTFFADGLIDGVDPKDIHYHEKPCLSNYKKQYDRSKKKRDRENEENVAPESNPITSEQVETRSSKRLKVDSTKTISKNDDEEKKPAGKKPCIICNQLKFKGTTTLYRICEPDRAQLFLSAIKYNKDEVFTRCSFLETVGNVFGNDIMYHKTCMTNYLRTFEREIEKLLNPPLTELEKRDMPGLFKDFMATIEIQSKAYSLSTCREQFQKFLEISDHIQANHITNRMVKTLLINHFDDQLAFVYPKDKRKSQMFYLSSVQTADVIETVRLSDSVKACVEKLKSECKSYDFELNESFRSSSDLKIAMEKLQAYENLETWNAFFNAFFPSRSSSEPIQRKCDVIFQVVFNMVNQGRQKTPLHTVIAESIHDTCKSKSLIEIFNHLGLCISYDDLERVDMSQTQQLINLAGPSRVPVSENIDDESLCHGAADNFDHEENTESGIGGSHDTILVLFQKGDKSQVKEEISRKPEDIATMSPNKRSLSHILECQKLIKGGKFSNRGQIPDELIVSEKPKFDKIKATNDQHFKSWLAARYLDRFEDHPKCIPTFSALNSFLLEKEIVKTKIAFTPILPHVATEYDTIFTVICNFQDVLRQKSQPYGPLWCDEGVYRLAKELQLIHQDRFSNIFLGLGGFHMEKVLIACCGKYLEETGIDTVLSENLVYGPENVRSVMDGGHYVRGARGMSLISEVIHTLKLDQFVRQTEGQVFEERDRITKEMMESNTSVETVNEALLQLHSKINSKKFQTFESNGTQSSNQFSFWNGFIDKIYPALRDLTRSHREGDWEMHLSAVQRALPLVFAFDRTNYKRWLPLYFEDCLSLPTKFPLIHDDFLQGGFVAKLSKRQGSAVPMDQALESQYNKPAKSSSGIIGTTRRKEAVCKWNLIKHEKSNYSNLLRKFAGVDEEDEYSLHHEFSTKKSESDQESISQIVSYISNRGNPFNSESKSIKNLATGATVDAESSSFLLSCVAKGEEAYNKFVKERLQSKMVKLFDKIPKMRRLKRRSKNWIPPDVTKETIHFLRIIDYSRLRNLDVSEILKYEIVTTSFFLTKDGELRKSPKSELQRELKEHLTKPHPTEVQESDLLTAVVIDFMAYARKIPPKRMHLSTYEDYFNALGKMFSRISRESTRIDIVFDVYLRYSIKQGERNRRCKEDPIETNIGTAKQKLPVDMNRFWASLENKMRFQQAFIKWVQENCVNDKPVYLGGAGEENVTACIRVCSVNPSKDVQSLRNIHEEADDRMMFHIHQAISTDRIERVIVASGDTDVFVCSIYHYTRWVYRGLKELWIVSGNSDSKTVLPIHQLAANLPSDVIDILPAVHALTGCDTTSKVGTKSSGLKLALSGNFHKLVAFGESEMDQYMIANAEDFLLRCISKDPHINSFDDLRNDVYYKKATVVDIEKLPPTSSSMCFHIQRSYLQTYIWLHAPFTADLDINPLHYGYEVEDEDDDCGDIIPKVIANVMPDDFPMPCKCVKCARETVCSCRKYGLLCCKYCNCKSDSCKNPYGYVNT